ncbi:glycosyltransferase [Arthrobacter sp. OVS8]|nr:glycosyltransferase [Arthrobacter sp. OVS8]
MIAALEKEDTGHGHRSQWVGRTPHWPPPARPRPRSSRRWGGPGNENPCGHHLVPQPRDAGPGPVQSGARKGSPVAARCQRGACAAGQQAARGRGDLCRTPRAEGLLNPRQPWTAVSVLRTLLRESSTSDVLHTMAFSSALVAALPAALKRMPWVHSEHWSGVTNPQNVAGMWPRFAWLRWVLRLPHAVTGVTAELVGKLQAFARPDAAVLVPCVVANERPVQPLPPGDRLRLVAVGGLVPGRDRCWPSGP